MVSLLWSNYMTGSACSQRHMGVGPLPEQSPGILQGIFSKKRDGSGRIAQHLVDNMAI
jgi:hypothetical protein